MKRPESANVWDIAGRFLPAAALICGGVMMTLIACVTWLNLSAETAPFAAAIGYAALGLAVAAAVVFLCRAVSVKNEAWFCICLAAAAFAVRGLFVLLAPTEPLSDFGNMYSVAWDLVRGDNAMNDVRGVYFQWWPYQTGFVAWMALWMRLFGVGVGFFQTMNCLCGAGTAVLVYALARRFASPQGARAAGLLYLVYPTSILLSPVLTNQHLSELLLMAAIYVAAGGERAMKPRLLRGGAAGLLLALSNIIRPSAIVAVAAVLVALVLELLQWKELDGRELASAVGGALAIVLAYFLITRGSSWLVQATGLNHYGLVNNVPQWKFILGLNLESVGGYSQADESVVFVYGQVAQIQEAAQRLLEERLAGLTPGKLIKLFLAKIKIMWGDFEPVYLSFTENVTDAYAARGQAEGLSWALNKAIRIASGLAVANSLLIAAGCVRAALKKEQGRQAAVLLTLTALAYFCAHLLIEIQVRYRTTLFVVAFPLTAIGADWMAELCGRFLARLREKRKETRL